MNGPFSPISHPLPIMATGKRANTQNRLPGEKTGQAARNTAFYLLAVLTV